MSGLRREKKKGDKVKKKNVYMEWFFFFSIWLEYAVCLFLFRFTSGTYSIWFLPPVPSHSQVIPGPPPISPIPPPPYFYSSALFLFQIPSLFPFPIPATTLFPLSFYYGASLFLLFQCPRPPYPSYLNTPSSSSSPGTHYTWVVNKNANIFSLQHSSRCQK